jgi:protein translocase SecG subunit
MENTLNIIEICAAIALIVLILLQKQGGGLSSVLGGSGGEIYRTKRGMEKWLMKGTVVLAIILMGMAILRILL